MFRFHGWETANVTDDQGRTPRDIYDLLSNIWCEYTCAPRMRKDWSEANRTLGQCSITAFLAQDLFGGKVYGVPLEDGNYHCFNVVGDESPMAHKGTLILVRVLFFMEVLHEPISENQKQLPFSLRR